MTVQVLRGGACTQLGEVHTRSAPGWGMSLSRGLKSPAVKVDPNEDACGLVVGRHGTVAVVADAHFGRSSAEVVVDHVLSMGLHEPPPPDASASAARAWLSARLDTAHHRVCADRDRSACAVLAVIVQGQRLWWASIGDCRLYHVRGAHSQVCNPLTHFYLGDRGMIHTAHGAVDLAAGDVVVLASDGLPECRYGRETLGPQDVQATVQGRAPEVAAPALVAAALAGGGEDNIAVVVGQI